MWMAKAKLLITGK